MNEWFAKVTKSLKDRWGKWDKKQKAIVAGIVVVIIAALVVMASMSSKPATVRLFNAPVNDENERTNILFRLDKDNVKAYVDSSNYISVDTDAIAKRYRTLLITEGLAPANLSAYDLFNDKSWSRNSFDDKVKWKEHVELKAKKQIESLDGIQRAEITVTIPDEADFTDDQKPTTAAVTLYANSGSDVLSSKRKIKGIQSLIKTCVEGLRDENITIMNGDTDEMINDFEGMAESDRISNISKQQKLIQNLEATYQTKVLNALRTTFSDKRVRVANMKIEMDMSERTSNKKNYTGITIRPDNPNTPYDDSEIVQSLVISEETVDKSFTGTGFNPEGPAGVEGQNPPVYSDMSNVIGKSTENGAKRNYALNEEITSEKSDPVINRITLSVNIDGTWRVKYDENNNKILKEGHLEREYIPISEEELAKITKLVQDAVGYSRVRGDSVTVTNVAWDHSEEFNKEDEDYIKLLNRNKTIMFSLIGIAVVLVAFILFRVISREIERRRRLAEEERIRQQEAERQQALFEAQQQGMEVTMSVEERKRAELQEGAIAMAKEHPEDVAMLIRTWLMEE